MPREAAPRRLTLLAAATGAAIASLLTRSAVALADTPTFGPGFPPPPDPEPDRGLTVILEPFLWIAIVALVVVGILAVIRFLARSVAGSDGRAVGTAEQTAEPPRAPAPRRISWVHLVLPAIAIMVGGLAGRGIAFQESLGGFGGAIGAGVLTFGLGVLAAGLGLVGLLALRLRGGRPNAGVISTLGAAGCLVIGAVAGNATAGATGTSQPPVVHEARGTTQAALSGAPFNPVVDGLAECRSVPDSEAVESVTGLDLGTIDGATLRGTVAIPDVVSDPATLELWIDGADLPEGAAQPFWDGRGAIEAIGSDGASGTVRFERLPRSAGPDKPGMTESPGGWPEALSGEITWRCEAWARGSS